MEPIDRIKPLGLFLGFSLMIIGLVFLIIPNQIVNFMATLIGVVLVVTGFFRVLTVSINWKVMENQLLILLLGLAILGTGIYIIINTQATVTLIGIILGIFAILMAFDRFLAAFKNKEHKSRITPIVFGLIHLAFGVGLIYASMAMFSLVVILYGIYFLLAGLLVVLSLLLYKDF